MSADSAGMVVNIGCGRDSGTVTMDVTAAAAATSGGARREAG